MALLTEEDVRRMSNQGTRGPVVVNRDQMLTPGARDYLRAVSYTHLLSQQDGGDEDQRVAQHADKQRLIPG